jgi:hypothetical protein
MLLKGLLHFSLTLLFLGILCITFGCTPADNLSRDKRYLSETVGLPRTFKIISAYTGQPVYSRFIKNSYFDNTDNTEVEVLDLVTKDKITFIISTGFLLVIEEGDPQ